jgi:hypothetical protein
MKWMTQWKSRPRSELRELALAVMLLSLLVLAAF